MLSLTPSRCAMCDTSSPKAIEVANCAMGRPRTQATLSRLRRLVLPAHECCWPMIACSHLESPRPPRLTSTHAGGSTIRAVSGYASLLPRLQARLPVGTKIQEAIRPAAEHRGLFRSPILITFYSARTAHLLCLQCTF